jgi:3-oxoacyl-[acyl-carrier protein] reductase
MTGLNERIALVTGASQGIGRACALELARAGATVALAARNESKLADAVAEIEAAGGRAAAFALDIASEESIRSCARSILDRFGKVEILVNNAGITRDGLMLRMKRADWDDVLATNLTGAFLLTQALLGAMLKNRWGRIVNITSVVGRTGQAGQANYAASKAGMIGMTRSMAREVASRGITVNAVAPGYIETPMTAVLDEKQRAAMMAAIPLGRPGTDREIAQAVTFLASRRRSPGIIHGAVRAKSYRSRLDDPADLLLLCDQHGARPAAISCHRRRLPAWRPHAAGVALRPGHDRRQPGRAGGAGHGRRCGPIRSGQRMLLQPGLGPSARPCRPLSCAALL